MKDVLPYHYWFLIKVLITHWDHFGTTGTNSPSSQGLTILTSSLVTSSQSISYAVYTRLGMQSSVKLSIPQRQLSLMLDHVHHLVNGQD